MAEGLSLLDSIVGQHTEVKFPLVFLGLGRAYYQQNRFKLAIVQLQKGFVLVCRPLDNSSLSCCVLTWPGSSTVIPETRPGQLQVCAGLHQR